MIALLVGSPLLASAACAVGALLGAWKDQDHAAGFPTKARVSRTGRGSPRLDDRSGPHSFAGVLPAGLKTGASGLPAGVPVAQSQLGQDGIHRLADRHPSKIAVVTHGATIART
jgi:hypothetical protein